MLDQSGTQDTRSKYVEFVSVPAGHATECTYILPSGISANSITELRVHVNYRGSTRSVQRWEWALKKSAGGLVSLGDNGAAASWRWGEMIFAVPGNPADYINGGALRLVYRTTRSLHASDLDYQVVELVLGGAPAPAPPTAAPSGSAEPPIPTPTVASALPTATGTRPAPTATATTRPAPSRTFTSAPPTTTSTPRPAPSLTPTNAPPTTTSTTRPAPSPTPTSAPPTSTATTRPVPSPTPTSVPSGRSWSAVSSWVYQLSGYQNSRLDQIAASHFNLAVVDLARDGSTDYFTRPEVAAVQASGKFALAYFEIGAIEDYRPEWSQVPSDMKLGAVGGWPSEQYVKYWDERWWPIVKGRVDQAIAAGFDGAYLDMIVTYEEIPADAAGTNRNDLAARMVDLIARLSQYAKSIDPNFKVLPQNSPELRTWPKYLPAIDGIGMEELYFLATDKACSQSWCADNRNNAAAIRSAGKRVLTIDYANNASNIASAYTQSRTAGFVSYASVVNLDTMRINPGWDP